MPTIRVLLADDHKILRDGLCALLERQSDIEIVAEAADGREAARLAAERLDLRLGGVLDTSFMEYMVRPTASWRATDGLALEVGAVVLGGRTAPPRGFGEAAQWSGGPLGYWGDNDAWTAALRWIR